MTGRSSANLARRPILVMAGGTGGHIYPALAVARELQRCARDVIWLGTLRGLESRVVPAAGISTEWISVQGLRGKGPWSIILAPVLLLRALIQSLKIMIRHRPAAVLGMGGFVSGPGGLAAWLTRRPLIIHEQNAIAGLTNQLLARLARVVLQAFPGTFSTRLKAETVGNPVREEIAAIEHPSIRMSNRRGSFHLLVLGGSQGAKTLNQIVPAALAQIPSETRPEVKHQAGDRTIAEARAAYRQCAVTAELEPFFEDMAAVYTWADFVICRAGALTIAELAAAGLPAILVPYPAAVDDHQTANAKEFADAGAGVIVQEPELEAGGLAELMQQWLASREELLARASKARELAQPDALSRIVALCLEAGGVRS